MSHPRQLIRDEIYSLLAAGQATIDAAAGESVTIYNARILTVDGSSLPAISVTYTEQQGGEDVNQDEQRPGDYNAEDRTLIISIEVMTKRDTDKNAADQNDDICAAVEDIMAKNITLNSKADNIELYRIRFKSDPEGDGAARFIENLYRVNYKTIKAGA